MDQKLINVSVANLYREPTFKSEIINQALLGEIVELLDEKNGYFLIKLSDSYQGWIDEPQLCKLRLFPKNTAIIKSHCVQIHDHPDPSSQMIRDVTIGRKLPYLHKENDCLQVILPDGEIGWIEARHFGDFPGFSREMVIKMAREFIGCPYYWGGRTPKGLDCSGLVQLVYALLGRTITRDSWMQYQETKFVSDNFKDAQPADLLFFGKSTEEVNHVAIALGNGRIIHSNGMVRLNSLDPADSDYNSKTAQKFLAVKTYFE